MNVATERASGAVESAADITTPVVAPRRRRTAIVVWIVIIAALVVVGFAGGSLANSSQWEPSGRLDPESAGPDGTRALARILADHGVDVRITTSRDEAARLLGGGGATLATTDSPYLSDEAMAALLDAATRHGDDVVLLSPSARSLETLFPGARSAGVAPASALDPACTLPVAESAGAVTLRTLFDPEASGATVCYPRGERAGLLTKEINDSRASVIDARGVLSNDALATTGNAALGIGLLGARETLVWYVPSAADSDLAGADPPSIPDLTPAWVSPLLVLCLFAGVVAMLWRARRFGPLVSERMPVSVRASETMQGRARLYADGDDATHAAELLREGSRERIARSLGLQRAGARTGSATSAAHATTVADAAAALLGVAPAGVRALLIGPGPYDRAGLMLLSDGLRDLEIGVARARSASTSPAPSSAAPAAPTDTPRTPRTPPKKATPTNSTSTTDPGERHDG